MLRPRPIRPDSNRNPFSSWYPTRPRGTKGSARNTCAAVGHFCLAAPGHIPNPPTGNAIWPGQTTLKPHRMSKQRASYQTISSAAKRGKAPLITSSLSVPRSLTRLANGGELCFRDRPGIGGIRSRGRIVDVSAGEWLATNLSGGSPGAGPLPVARREPGE